MLLIIIERDNPCCLKINAFQAICIVGNQNMPVRLYIFSPERNRSVVSVVQYRTANSPSTKAARTRQVQPNTFVLGPLRACRRLSLGYFLFIYLKLTAKDFLQLRCIIKYGFLESGIVLAALFMNTLHFGVPFFQGIRDKNATLFFIR